MLRSRLWCKAAEAPSPRLIGCTAVLAGALALGGCSADLLRFDSPVFGLENSESPQSGAIGKSGSLADNREFAAGGTEPGTGYAAPVAGVERREASPVSPSTPALVETPQQPSPRETAVAQNYVPRTTGAIGGTVTVQPGDTLYQIARRNNVSVAGLREANGIVGNVIRPGQQLRIPQAGEISGAIPASPPAQQAYAAPRAPVTAPPAGSDTYVVRPGDSLYGIARSHNISVSELSRINGITDPRRLRPGQTLTLRLRADGSAPVAAPSSVARLQEPGDQTGGSQVFANTRKVPTTTYQPSAGTGPTIINPRAEPEPEPRRQIARATPSPADGGAVKFRWPARGRIISSFNPGQQGKKSDGISIALPLGADIQAAGDGVVAYAGSELAGYGNLILIRHENGWVSAYAHNDQMLVRRGDSVRAGQVIAKAGRSGEVSQPQLHFELRRDAKPVDPLPHLEQL